MNKQDAIDKVALVFGMGAIIVVVVLVWANLELPDVVVWAVPLAVVGIISVGLYIRNRRPRA